MASSKMLALTDGTGVSKLLKKKIVKDFVADFLLGAAAMMTVNNIAAIPTDVQGLTTAAGGIANALVHTIYRFALKWATS